MKNDNPLITVITVSFNSAKTIEKTILSVLDQTYKNIEYIIIDGGSTDGTLEIIKKYNDRVSYWISEKDGGIYDAMNKGIDASNGKYLNFMNSDDYFFKNNSIEDIVPFCNNENDLIYGNTEIRSKNIKLKIITPNPKSLWMGSFMHQSSFFKRDTIQKYKYNTDNKLIAAFELFLNIYYNKGKVLKVNKIVSSYSMEGLSAIKSNQALSDYYKTVKKFKKGFSVETHFILVKMLNSARGWTARKLLIF